MGVPGPDAGKGGKHLLLPPGWEGEVPDGYYVSQTTTYRLVGGVRSLPLSGDVGAWSCLGKIPPIVARHARRES
jgi:hypothetical protein